MLVKGLRNGLGMVIVFANWLTLPRQIRRPAGQQAEIDKQAEQLKLYQFRACPFCVKVRRHMHRLNVPVEVVESSAGTRAREELVAQGGKKQVPCLRIETAEGVQWLYESSAIIDYLNQHFAPEGAAA